MAATSDDTGGRRKGGAAAAPPPAPEQGLRCPRCDSPNTKFCYYNNYSLSQPRHFCKTCRRYWTKGGALRNVPVGGGCRKNKRSRSSSASAALTISAASSRLSLNLPVDPMGGTDVPSARMGFLGGPASSPLGAADFQAVGVMPLPRLHSPAAGQYMPFGEWPLAGDVSGGGGGSCDQMNGQAAVSSSIATSIESLSFINQDLHWKLQQQRLATMFLGPPPASPHVEGGVGAAAAHGGGGAFLQMTASASGMDAVPPAATWFMDSSYALPSPPPPPVVTTSGNINSGRSSGGGDDNTSSNDNNCGGRGAIPAWGDMPTFAMLP